MREKMEFEPREKITDFFESLSASEKIAIITHGIALYQSTLTKRLFLAQAKIKQYEAKYHTSLSKFEAEGLPDDASYEMHEDYIIWNHWTDTEKKLQGQIALISQMAENGLTVNEMFNVSH